VQETTISKLSAAKVVNLFKLWPYKVTVVHALQPHDWLAGFSFAAEWH
jgi:hypothetical protein